MTTLRRAFQVISGRREGLAWLTWLSVAQRLTARRNTDAYMHSVAVKQWQKVHAGGLVAQWARLARQRALVVRALGGVSASVAADVRKRALRVGMRLLSYAALTRRMALEAIYTLIARRLLSGWLALVGARRTNAGRARVAAAAAALRGLQRGERRAFNSWVEMREELMSIRSALWLAARSMLHAQTARAMRTWWYAAALVTRAKTTCARLRYAGALRALHTWREQRAAEKESARLRLWTAKRFASDPSALALATWHSHAIAHGRLIQRIRAFLPTTRSMRAAWASWLEVAEEARHQRRTVARWCHAELAAAVRTWAYHLKRFVAARTTVARVVHYESVRALRQWRGVAVEKERMRGYVMRMLGWRSVVAMATWRRAAIAMGRVTVHARRVLHSGVHLPRSPPIPWHSMTFNDLQRPSMTFHDLPWPSVAFRGLVCISLEPRPWPCTLPPDAPPSTFSHCLLRPSPRAFCPPPRRRRARPPPLVHSHTPFTARGRSAAGGCPPMVRAEHGMCLQANACCGDGTDHTRSDCAPGADPPCRRQNNTPCFSPCLRLIGPSAAPRVAGPHGAAVACLAHMALLLRRFGQRPPPYPSRPRLFIPRRPGTVYAHVASPRRHHISPPRPSAARAPRVGSAATGAGDARMVGGGAQRVPH